MSNSPERSFFKVMLTPTLGFNRLMIPNVFARKYYEELSDYCYLVVPTGVTHRVELDEEEDELWFGNGLEEFFNAFSIRYGDSLLFIYQGDSSFRVHIYGLTACEISYKQRHDRPSLGSSEELDSEPNVSVSSSASEDLQDEILDSGSESEASNCNIALMFSYFPYSDIPWLTQRGQELKALAKARIPVPNNPFFVTSIQDYNLDGCCLIVPISFDREHLRCESGGFVTVKVDDGRQWCIQCCRHKRRCILCHGWSGLAEEMHLEIGDVCLFEQIDVGKSLFHLLVV